MSRYSTVNQTVLRAGFFTRIIYSVALLAIVPAAFGGGSGWIGLALGGGIASGIGQKGLMVVAALIVFRVYQVFRYPPTLDARPPNVAGKCFRYAGWLYMLAGTFGVASMFLVKPIALAIFKTAGDGGIAYFIVGLGAVLISSSGWFGCLLFEISRVCGTRQTMRVPDPHSHRRQDFGVLVVLVLLAIASPAGLNIVAGAPCGESNLAGCVSSTTGGVRRMIGLPQGETVALETQIEEIELRGNSNGRKWSLKEKPAVSLTAAGYVLGVPASARVRMRLEAVDSPEGVTLTTMVFDGNEETARFLTRFEKGAVVEKLASGRVQITADLPGNARPGMRSSIHDPVSKKYFSLDQFFIQIRSGIGVEIEAKEWAKRVERPLISAVGTLVKEGDDMQNKIFGPSVDPACLGRVDAKVPDRETGKGSGPVGFEGEFGWPLWGATFSQSATVGPHTFLSSRDKIVCRQDEIWIVSEVVRRPALRVRKYKSDGTLVRFVDTSIPPAKLGAMETTSVDPFSVLEEQGKIRFERVILGHDGVKPKEKKREVFEIAP